jgi:hypothetical protein
MFPRDEFANKGGVCAKDFAAGAVGIVVEHFSTGDGSSEGATNFREGKTDEDSCNGSGTIDVASSELVGGWASMVIAVFLSVCVDIDGDGDGINWRKGEGSLR